MWRTSCIAPAFLQSSRRLSLRLGLADSAPQPSQLALLILLLTQTLLSLLFAAHPLLDSAALLPVHRVTAGELTEEPLGAGDQTAVLLGGEL